MLCRKCGYELIDSANFCLNCGSPVKISDHKQVINMDVVQLGMTSMYFTVSTTNSDIIEFCLQAAQTMSWKFKYSEHENQRIEIPGRLYLYITSKEGFEYRNIRKLKTFYEIIKNKLLTEGWKFQPDIGYYIREKD